MKPESDDAKCFLIFLKLRDGFVERHFSRNFVDFEQFLRAVEFVRHFRPLRRERVKIRVDCFDREDFRLFLLVFVDQQFQIVARRMLKNRRGFVRIFDEHDKLAARG